MKLAAAHGSVLRKQRDLIELADESAGLVARHRLLESIGYFLRADRLWAKHFLLAPLKSGADGALPLWRAVAQRTQFGAVLKHIGTEMALRATDDRLSRETRSSLVFSLVVECMNAYMERRKPVVPHPRIQQMLRLLDDEVRAHAADAVRRYVSDRPVPPKSKTPPTSEEVFRRAAAPFLRNVWPQEKSLVTPGSSRALADLPILAGESFPDAVEAVLDFLAPFECWSLNSYGFGAGESDAPNLSAINSRQKAAALLKLLDQTIGAKDGSTIPHDLGDAIDHIQRVAPSLARLQSFKRLATSARRV